jgi:hypothetical protein
VIAVFGRSSRCFGNCAPRLLLPQAPGGVAAFQRRQVAERPLKRSTSQVSRTRLATGFGAATGPVIGLGMEAWPEPPVCVFMPPPALALIPHELCLQAWVPPSLRPA